MILENNFLAAFSLPRRELPVRQISEQLLPTDSPVTRLLPRTTGQLALRRRHYTTRPRPWRKSRGGNLGVRKESATYFVQPPKRQPADKRSSRMTTHTSFPLDAGREAFPSLLSPAESPLSCQTPAPHTEHEAVTVPGGFARTFVSTFDPIARRAQWSS